VQTAPSPRRARHRHLATVRLRDLAHDPAPTRAGSPSARSCSRPNARRACTRCCAGSRWSSSKAAAAAIDGEIADLARWLELDLVRVD